MSDPDLLEDFIAFLYATGDDAEPREVQSGETITCSVCGRELDEGERYYTNGDVRCNDCSPEL